MSQDHEQPSSDTHSVSDAIRPEVAPFEPGYQPETLPHIQVPDLAEDAQSLTAEALAQVPTLTELVDGEHDEPVDVQSPVSCDDTAAEPIQAEPAQADTWSEQLHARMGKLTDDIQTLNARLDRLEERNNTKV
jgi:hypothetical protein